jgi:hypothetical protein
MSRLVWGVPSNGYGTVQGRAGKVLLFAISYRIKSSDPKFYLQTMLPGFKTSVKWTDDSSDVLKERAETILASWLDATGIIPKT